MAQDENTLILGICGVGMHLAQRLSHEGYPVTVIESNPDLILKAKESLDARLNALVEKVSKLNGRRIRVIGSSLMISIEISIKEKIRFFLSRG